MIQPTQENPIRLVLLDDQALLRASLAHLLGSEPDIEVVGHCGTSAEALEMLRASPVDVVLSDFGHAAESGEGFLAIAVRNGFLGKLLIIADGAEPDIIAAAIRLGSSGIFVKSEAPHRLLQAIRVVAAGGAWLDAGMIRLLAYGSVNRSQQPPIERFRFPLTDREHRVLLGILNGLTNKKIGQTLGISEGTVKTSVQQLFHRTGVRTRGQLVRVALEGSWNTSPSKVTLEAAAGASLPHEPALL